MDKPKIVVGIDPDIDKSGFALLDVEAKTIREVKAFSFPELIMRLNGLSCDVLMEQHSQADIIVVIEDSDDTTNWHLGANVSARSAAATGHNVGLCHATQRHIKEWAEHIGFNVELMRPLKKCWLGKDGKITQDEISQFVPDLPKKINQECRDACLLAWSYANLPIKISPEFYQTHQRKGLTAQTKGKYKVCDGRMTAEEFRKALGLKVDEK